MKKILVGAVAVLSVAAMAFAGTDYTGTKLGGACAISDGVDGGIAIGDGSTNGFANVTASGACQIGIGSNGIANTLKFRSSYVVTGSSSATEPVFDGKGITNISAANLKAGTVATAINGAAITNLTAGNIAAGGTLPAVDGSALTSLAAANLAGNIAIARMTNALGGLTNKTITIINGGGTGTNVVITIVHGVVTAATP